MERLAGKVWAWAGAPLGSGSPSARASPAAPVDLGVAKVPCAEWDAGRAGCVASGLKARLVHALHCL